MIDPVLITIQLRIPGDVVIRQAGDDQIQISIVIIISEGARRPPNAHQGHWNEGECSIPIIVVEVGLDVAAIIRRTRDQKVDISIAIVVPCSRGPCKRGERGCDLREDPSSVIVVEFRYGILVSVWAQGAIDKNVETAVVIVVEPDSAPVVIIDAGQRGTDIDEGSVIIPVDFCQTRICRIGYTDAVHQQIEVAIIIEVPPLDRAMTYRE